MIARNAQHKNAAQDGASIADGFVKEETKVEDEQDLPPRQALRKLAQVFAW